MSVCLSVSPIMEYVHSYEPLIRFSIFKDGKVLTGKEQSLGWGLGYSL